MINNSETALAPRSKNYTFALTSLMKRKIICLKSRTQSQEIKKMR